MKISQVSMNRKEGVVIKHVSNEMLVNRSFDLGHSARVKRSGSEAKKKAPNFNTRRNVKRGYNT